MAGSKTYASEMSTQDTVIILHGIGHTSWNMRRVENALGREGYQTINITYPSTKKELAALAVFLDEKFTAEKIWARQGRIHFVTHSMGGLVGRRYLEDFRTLIPAEKMGRFVMIAPPNGGSEIADLLCGFPPYQWIFGPAGLELTTSVRSADKTVPWYETGVIAGSLGWPYFAATFFIDGAHDGRVAVEKTKLPGMKAHITVPRTHSFISWNDDVHSHAVHFIKNGEFIHDQ